MGWGTLFLGRMRQTAYGGQKEIAASAQALLLDSRIIWCHKAYLEVSKLAHYLIYNGESQTSTLNPISIYTSFGPCSGASS